MCRGGVESAAIKEVTRKIGERRAVDDEKGLA